MNSIFDKLVSEAEAKSKKIEKELDTSSKEGRIEDIAKSSGSIKPSQSKLIMPGELEKARELKTTTFDPYTTPVIHGASRDIKKDLISGGYGGENMAEDYEGLAQLTYAEYQVAINKAYIGWTEGGKNRKTSLVVWGEPGIGKSAGARSFCERMAAAKGKTFVAFDELNKESPVWKELETNLKKREQFFARIKEIRANPSKYFVFCDVRVSGMDPTDVQGIPDLRQVEVSDYLSFKKPLWVILLCEPGIDGCLFLDEVNQGDESVQNAFYKVILDRKLSDNALADDVGIIACGNLGAWAPDDNLKGGLAQRFEMYSLFLQPEEWFWYAEESGVHPLIVDFVRTKPDEFFYQRPEKAVMKGNRKSKSPNVRNFVALSDKIKQIEGEYQVRAAAGEPFNFTEQLMSAAEAACGTKWAVPFVTYVEDIRNFDWSDIMKDPSAYTTKSAQTSTRQIWAFISYLRNKVSKVMPFIDVTKKTVPEEAKKPLRELAYVLGHSNNEWSIILLNQLKKESKDQHWEHKLLHGCKDVDYGDPATQKIWQEKAREVVKMIMAGNVTAKPASYKTEMPTAEPAATPEEVPEVTPETLTPEAFYNGLTGMFKLYERDLALIIYKSSVITRRVLTLEERNTIGKHPTYAYLYATKVKKAPFYEGEKAILTNERLANDYLIKFGSIQTHSQKKFNTLFEDIVKLYEGGEETYGWTKLPKMSPKTPNRGIINQIMDAIENKFGFDWLHMDISTMSNLEKRLPEVLKLANDTINSSVLAPLEKKMMADAVNQSIDMVSLLNRFNVNY